MKAIKILGMASIVALMAAPTYVVADESGGAMDGLGEWIAGGSAVEGVKNGALATLAVAGAVGLGFGIAELADDDDSSTTTTTTTTTTTN